MKNTQYPHLEIKRTRKGTYMVSRVWPSGTRRDEQEFATFADAAEYCESAT